MTTPSAPPSLRRSRGPLARFAPFAAFLSAALLSACPAAAAPAAPPPSACPGPGRVNIAVYNFSFLSRPRGQGGGGGVLNCVHNFHTSRGLFVDWPRAGLRTTVPPRIDAFVSRPLGHSPIARSDRLYYGALPNFVAVATWAATDAVRPGLAEPWFRFLVRRAAYDQPAGREVGTAPEAPTDLDDAVRDNALRDNAVRDDPGPDNISTALVYVPADPAFLAAFARNPMSQSALVAWLETHPGQLAPFRAAFNVRAAGDAAGRQAMAYELRYSLPALPGPGGPLLYLRFSDPALHRLMFGAAAPFAVARADAATPFSAARGRAAGGGAGGDGGGEAVRRGMTYGDGRGREMRVARLDVLLGDGRTIVASFALAYPAP